MLHNLGNLHQAPPAYPMATLGACVVCHSSLRVGLQFILSCLLASMLNGILMQQPLPTHRFPVPPEHIYMCRLQSLWREKSRRWRTLALCFLVPMMLNSWGS